MDSVELNYRIRNLENSENAPYESFGGKCIPYIGWFWRDVNFDSESYSFGILPVTKGWDANDKPRLGFMENNKWGYDYKFCPPEIWSEIKSLLEIAVILPTHDKLKAVDDKIQSLLG